MKTLELHVDGRWCRGCEREPIGIVYADAEGGQWWAKPHGTDLGAAMGEARSESEARACVEARARRP